MSRQILLRTIRATVIVFAVIVTIPVAGAAAPSGTLVVLVRHAEKNLGGGVDPALSGTGSARAKVLVDVLSDAHIDRIITSQFQRTRQTAAPLAAARGLTPTVVPASGSMQQHVRGVVSAIRAHPEKAVLVVGHTNTVPLIIHALGGPRLAELDDRDYATLFVLLIAEEGRARLVRSRYGAPDAIASAGIGAVK